MVWSKKLGIFFFVGFVLAEMMHLQTIGIAIIALAIAMSIFLIEQSLNKVNQKIDEAPAATPGTSGSSQEDSLF